MRARKRTGNRRITQSPQKVWIHGWLYRMVLVTGSSWQQSWQCNHDADSKKKKKKIHRQERENSEDQRVSFAAEKSLDNRPWKTACTLMRLRMRSLWGDRETYGGYCVCDDHRHKLKPNKSVNSSTMVFVCFACGISTYVCDVEDLARRLPLTADDSIMTPRDPCPLSWNEMRSGQIRWDEINLQLYLLDYVYYLETFTYNKMECPRIPTLLCSHCFRN